MIICILSVIIAGTFQIKELLVQKGCIPLEEGLFEIELPISQETFSFVAIGDTGTGSVTQKTTSQGMRKVCKDLKCNFGLLLGDNVYKRGVSSVNDPKFKLLFENMYSDLDFPFFVVLGNHDTKGNSLAQVQYSLKNPKWKMPNFVYSFKLGATNFVAGNSSCNLLNLYLTKSFLINSDSRWTIYFQHHPIYSTGPHGDAELIVRWFWNWFMENGVDLYLSGHDHHLEYLENKRNSTVYIVSGSGGKNSLNHKDLPKSTQASSQFSFKGNGFVWIRIEGKKMIGHFYNKEGKLLYKFQKIKN